MKAFATFIAEVRQGEGGKYLLAMVSLDHDGMPAVIIPLAPGQVREIMTARSGFVESVLADLNACLGLTIPRPPRPPSLREPEGAEKA